MRSLDSNNKKQRLGNRIASFFFTLTCISITTNVYAADIETITYDEIDIVGEGITDGLGYVWRFSWDGMGGALREGPTGAKPDVETFWKSEVLFDSPASGDPDTVEFFSVFHKRPMAAGHLGDLDRDFRVQVGPTFEIKLFTENPDFLRPGTRRIAKKIIEHPSDSEGTHIDSIFVDFIREEDGDLFFEMRGEHTRSSPEPSVFLGLGTLALAGGTLLRRKQR